MTLCPPRLNLQTLWMGGSWKGNEVLTIQSILGSDDMMQSDCSLSVLWVLLDEQMKICIISLITTLGHIQHSTMSDYHLQQLLITTFSYDLSPPSAMTNCHLQLWLITTFSSKWASPLSLTLFVFSECSLNAPLMLCECSWSESEPKRMKIESSWQIRLGRTDEGGDFRTLKVVISEH